MSTYEDAIAISLRSARAGSLKAQSGTARDALLAYAMMGSAVGSLAIIAAF